MKRSLGLLALLSAAAIGLAGCGGGVPSAARYASARQVIAALGQGGMPCTGASYGNPVVQGASSEASCSFKGDPSQLIDVFPGRVSTAMVLQNSVSTGTEKIWSAVGPNWWVQTTKADAKQVQQVLGGRIIGGPWHPPGSVTLSYGQGEGICYDLNTWAQTANNQDTPRFNAQLEADENEAAGSQLGEDLVDLDESLQAMNSAALDPGPPGDEQPVQEIESDCSAYGVTFTP